MHETIEQVGRIIEITDRNRKLGLTRFECEVAALGLLTDKEGFNKLCWLHTQVNMQFTEMNASTKVGGPIPEQVVYPNIMKTIHDIGLRVVKVDCNPVIDSPSDLVVRSNGLLFFESRRIPDGSENAHLFAIKPIDSLPRVLRRKYKEIGCSFVVVDTGNQVTVGVISRAGLQECINERSEHRDIGLFVVELAKRSHH